ncbi:hypothetical protein [Nonomuraea sp. bgisy101]|uniref:hypothetical protein n=1 Tax=Nonomuraea sp. bgisy101 TaxID=3413784 RepID=UPI003D723A92
MSTAIGWTGAGRAGAAAVLLGTGLCWAAAAIIGPAWSQPESPHWAAAHPTRAGLALTFDILSIPLLIGTMLVWLLLARPGAPRLAWSGAALLTGAAAGQGIVEGVELAGYLIAQSDRIDPLAYSDVLGSGSGLPMVVFEVLFMGGASLGLLLMMIALWRSRAVPRVACALLVVLQAAEFLGPPLPYVLGTGAVLAWMAASVLRRPVTT